MLRTHTCGELRKEHIGQRVTLCGWVESARDHGKTVFLDLRDRYGRTQVMVSPDSGADALQIAKDLRGEDVALFTGTVHPRLEGKTNEKLDTGDIELVATEVRLLNRCQTHHFSRTRLSCLAKRHASSIALSIYVARTCRRR